MSADTVIPLLFLLGMSIFCWFMVLSPSLRGKFSRSGSRFWRLGNEDREGWDALMLAGYLVMALVFSVITLALIFIGFYRFVDR